MILRDFRKQLEKVINESGLPIDAVYFVLKDILNEATQIYENTIREEYYKRRRATTSCSWRTREKRKRKYKW